MEEEKKEMKAITRELKEFFDGLSTAEKDEAFRQISKICNVAFSTVNCWRLGFRTPRERIEPVLRRFMKKFKSDIESNE